jgi:hypothetical protein
MAKTANDPFQASSGIANLPPRRGASVTPSDTADLVVVTKAIYVGGAGDVTVILADDNEGGQVTFKAVPVATTLNVQARRVMATGTTATLLLALW